MPTEAPSDKEQIDNLFNKIEEKVNGETLSENLTHSELEAELGIQDISVSIGWEDEGEHRYILFDKYGGDPTTPLRVPPNRIPVHLLRQLFEIANQIEADGCN